MKKSKKYNVNVGSNLLSSEENANIFNFIGDDCTTKSTAVIQLYKTENPYHNQWFKQHTGVLCLIRDAYYKKYFFRMYCLESNTLLWELCIPPGFQYVESASFMHEFYGRDCVFGLNFADEREAKSFREILIETVKTIKVSKRTKSVKSSKKRQNVKTKKTQKPVISNPSDFKHIQHVGYSNWLDLSSEIEKLSGKVDASEPAWSTTTINGGQVLAQIEEETVEIETFEENKYITEELENMSTLTAFENAQQEAKVPENPQCNYLSELNSKFGSKRNNPPVIKSQSHNIRTNDEITYSKDGNNDNSLSCSDLLRQALKERRFSEDEEESDYSDEDSDEWN